MKNWMLSLAAFVALGFAAAPAANAQAYGKVITVVNYGQTYFGFTGLIVGRTTYTNTYWYVSTTPALSDASLSRILSAATTSAFSSSPNGYFTLNDIAPYAPGQGYGYTTNPTTGFQLVNW